MCSEPGAVALLTWFGMGAWVKEPIGFPVDEDEHIEEEGRCVGAFG
jgi:hypothetical protein